MPVSYAISGDHNLVTIRLREAVVGHDAVRAAEQIVNDPHLRPGMNGIVNMRGAQLGSFAASDVRAIANLAHRADHYWTGTRWAFVADSPVLYGFARMYQLLRSRADCEIRVFRVSGEADAWLNDTAAEHRELPHSPQSGHPIQ